MSWIPGVCGTVALLKHSMCLPYQLVSRNVLVESMYIVAVLISALAHYLMVKPHHVFCFQTNHTWTYPGTQPVFWARSPAIGGAKIKPVHAHIQHCGLKSASLVARKSQRKTRSIELFNYQASDSKVNYRTSLGSLRDKIATGKSSSRPVIMVGYNGGQQISMLTDVSLAHISR